MWVCLIAAILLIVASCLVENERIVVKKKEEPLIEKVERPREKRIKWPFGE